MSGLAILDNDGQNRVDRDESDGRLRLRYWRRYEAENYFITPELLKRYAYKQYPSDDLFTNQARQNIDEILNSTILELVFANDSIDFDAWISLPLDAARLVWEAKTERIKLSTFAEEFFRRLSASVGGKMFLSKGELHRLVPYSVLTVSAKTEIRSKLDMLETIFKQAI